MTTRALCEDCGWIGLWAGALTAPNPFDPEDEVYGCPMCKGINTLSARCDVDGCSRPVSTGTPTPAGYRSTCWEHRPPEVDEPPRPSALTEEAMLREAQASVALDPEHPARLVRLDRDQTHSVGVPFVAIGNDEPIPDDLPDEVKAAVRWARKHLLGAPTEGDTP